jgi:molybdopterin-guanine dinucleotide biosynthesis adapter protein
MRVIGIAGWSGAGKTTLLTALIPHLVGRGLKVSTIKHAHHGLDFDRKGKDSYAHRLAGATEVLVSSAARWALVHELRGAAEPALPALVEKLAPVDLVLVEGFKGGPHPKVEVYREALGKPLLFPGDSRIIAVASDRPLPNPTVPLLKIDDTAGIAEIMLARAVPAASLFERTF